MLYQLRTGNVILCENKKLNQTNAYLIVYDNDNGFGLWCLSCGEAFGFYGDDVVKMKENILDKDFLNVQAVIPKELITGYLKQGYRNPTGFRRWVVHIGTEYMADRYKYVHYELHGEMLELSDDEKYK